MKLLSLLLVLLLATSSFGFEKQEPIDNEVSNLIATARILEQTPFDKRAKDLRKSALAWIIVTDKVRVVMCSFLMNGVEKDEKYKYGGEMMTQYTIGMAAFKLANPGKDEPSAQLAGFESALLSYEGMLKTQPKAKNAFLDELIAKRSDGTLADYLAANNCKDKK